MKEASFLHCMNSDVGMVKHYKYTYMGLPNLTSYCQAESLRLSFRPYIYWMQFLLKVSSGVPDHDMLMMRTRCNTMQTHDTKLHDIATGNRFL